MGVWSLDRITSALRMRRSKVRLKGGVMNNPRQPALKTFDQLPAPEVGAKAPPGKVGRLAILRQDNTPFPLVDVQVIFQWTENGQPAFTAPYLVAKQLDASSDGQIPGPDIDLDMVYLFYREGTGTNAPRRVAYIVPHRDWKPGDHWQEIIIDFLYVSTLKGIYYGTEQFIR